MKNDFVFLKSTSSELSPNFTRMVLGIVFASISIISYNWTLISYAENGVLFSITPFLFMGLSLLAAIYLIANVIEDIC